MWDIILDFIIETSKVFGLIIGLSFIVSFLQTFIPFKKFLDKAFKNNNPLSLILVIALGFLSPFCSCTIIPVVVVLIKSDMPLSLTFAFFTSAGLLNITGLAALFATMPVNFVLLYMAFALILCVVVYLAFIKVKDYKKEKAAVVAALATGDCVEACACGHEHEHECACGHHGHHEHKQDSLKQDKDACSCTAKEHGRLRHKHKHEFKRIPDIEAEQCKTFKNKLIYSFRNTLNLLSDIWIFLLAAMIISFVIKELVTQEVLSSLVSGNLAATNILLSLIGTVLHGEIVVLIPVLQMFNTVGLPYATILAFLGTAVAVSIPLLIALWKIVKIKHIIIYNGVIAGYFMAVSLIAMLF